MPLTMFILLPMADLEPCRLTMIQVLEKYIEHIELANPFNVFLLISLLRFF